MKTTTTIEIIVNGEAVRATSDGQIIRHKKPVNAKSILLRGGLSSHGYRRISINNQPCKVHRLIARAFLSDYSEDLQVDHIDGNRSNNRPRNLRMVTNRQNAMAYQSARMKSSSPYRGVSSCRGKWRSELRFEGKHHYLGSFDTELEAAKAYNEGATRLGFFDSALNNLTK